MIFTCPFKIGDLVTFSPDHHTVGWYQHCWDRFRLKPGDKGIVTAIDDKGHIWLDDGRGGFRWQEYKPVNLDSE